ncbi:hypothetical protein, partial [Bacillus toyonensis]|uniref:hypothetical protein n=1 Tax=Bacillus toyonensis TaxID=155322 RepID=UPI002E22F44A|nr:hypothetical protein [Bacillus toyonensis]
VCNNKFKGGLTTSYYYCKYCNEYKKKSHDCYRKSSQCDGKYVKVNCCGNKKEELVRASAFRAVNTVNQPILANTSVKVLFQNEQFDLANEYNPVTSTFMPKTRGVYSVLGNITFSPNDINVNYRARVEIRVNGNTAIAIDNDFFGPIGFGNVVSVSTIIQLNAGDIVEIYAQSSIDGVLSPLEDGSHFEAARFPSPTK